MDKEKFKVFMPKYQLRVEGNLAFGNVNGYPVLVKNQQGKNIEILFYLEDHPWKRLREKMIALAKSYHSKVFYEESHLVWKTKLDSRDQERFQNMLNGIVDLLIEADIPVPKTCALCGKEHTDAFAVISEENRPVHKECLKEGLDDARDFKAKGGYLRGFLGALLGCIVGSIPCFLSLLLVGKVYCVLFLFVPPAVYYGCRLLGGKMNYYVLVLSVIFAVFSVYWIEIVLRVQYNLELQNLPVNLEYFGKVLVELLKCDGIFSVLTKSAGINFLFALMGVLIDWELISQTSLKAEENIVSVIDTVNYAQKEKK